MAAGLLAIALAAIAGFAALDARGAFGPRHPLVCLGRASLTLLLLHVWLFREVSRPLGLWQANDAPTALAILLGFVVVATVAARAWARIDYRYGAEWCLRRLAG
jgi:fucose 4-O-acetylase-like acetyltransferase